MLLSPELHQWASIFCITCGHTIRVPIGCKHRFCPLCSPRRARRIRARLKWIFKHVDLEPGVRFVMITLSCPSSQDLDKGILHLVKSFRRLRQRAFWKRYVQGGAYIIEITRSKAGWHPHLHIIATSKFLPWTKLKDQWGRVSSGLACFIQQVDAQKAANYITKYLTKTTMSPDNMDAANDCLKNNRLFTRFGSWHDLTIPKRIYDYPCPICKCTEWVPQVMIDIQSRKLARGS